MATFDHYPWADKLPAATLDVSEEHYHEFFRTMFERQMIWKRRFLDQKPRPWTDDPILRDYKFTNVYRELDRNSQWQIRNILLDDELTLTNLVWKMMVFRYFNNPPTFEYAREKYGWGAGIPDYNQYDEKTFAEMVASYRLSGHNPFTTAYLINSMAAPGKTRDECYTGTVVPTLHRRLYELMRVVLTAKTPEDIIQFLRTLPASAAFIAHEFYQDFTYIPRYTYRRFMRFTQDDYTNVGPGASTGLRLIFPSLKCQVDGIYRLRDEAAKALSVYGDFPYLHWHKPENGYYTTPNGELTLHQVEMWLCEYQKYWKVKIGQGKQRSLFQPHTKSDAFQ